MRGDLPLLGSRNPGRRAEPTPWYQSNAGRATLMVLALIAGLSMFTRIGAAPWSSAVSYSRVKTDSSTSQGAVESPGRSTTPDDASTPLETPSAVPTGWEPPKPPRKPRDGPASGSKPDPPKADKESSGGSSGGGAVKNAPEKVVGSPAAAQKQPGTVTQKPKPSTQGKKKKTTPTPTKTAIQDTVEASSPKPLAEAADKDVEAAADMTKPRSPENKLSPPISNSEAGSEVPASEAIPSMSTGKKPAKGKRPTSKDGAANPTAESPTKKTSTAGYATRLPSPTKPATVNEASTAADTMANSTAAPKAKPPQRKAAKGEGAKAEGAKKEVAKKGATQKEGYKEAQEKLAATVQPEVSRGTPMMSQKAPAIPREKGRKTLLKIVVLPVHPCQVVSDVTQNQCMYGGQEAAQTPACVEAISGEPQNAYLAPLVRVQPHMSGAGIRKYSVAPVWSAEMDSDSKRKWEFLVSGADIVILNELAFERHSEQVSGKKIILLQSDTSASLDACEAPKRCSQTLLAEDRVLAFFQHTSFLPLSINNAPRSAGRVHLELLSQVKGSNGTAGGVRIGAAAGPPAFTDKMLAKVHTIIPLVWSLRFPVQCKARLQDWVEFMMPSLQGGVGDFPPWLRPMQERGHDLTFLGATRSNSTPSATKNEKVADALYSSHLKALAEKVRSISSANPDLKVRLSEHVNYKEYATQLRDTKLVVSPWGHGEYTWLDYEAIISRAVLIKPMADSLAAYPDIYDVGVTCVKVALDFSDLDVVVKGLLADNAKMQRIADNAYQRLLHHVQERRFAYDLGQVLLDVIKSTMPDHVIPQR